MPLPVASLPILIVKRRSAENTTAEFRVRRQKVLDALLRLKQNNKFYHDICIDHIYAANLPQDGIPSDLQQLETEEDSVPMPPQGPPSVCTESSVSNEETEMCQTNSFLPIPQGVRLEDDGIRQTINGYALDWPELSLRGINEFSTEGLATLAFPTLFPFDRGDPTCKQ